ncbi:MAG TPA: hypothetical protein VJZ94_03770 [Candidatus Paceibacterota bacterium]|nr:hypothetical protein [Candidatus Paceibacterota bacterium]
MEKKEPEKKLEEFAPQEGEKKAKEEEEIDPAEYDRQLAIDKPE